MYEKLIAMLTDFGFSEVANDTEPGWLGETDYMLAVAGGKRMVTIGPGRGGDGQSYTVFYFTLDSGEFLMHGTSNDSEDA